jgi:hypothetical protein
MVSFTPWPLNPWERTPAPHWIEGWVGPRAGLDAVVKRKILIPYRESNLGRPARNLVAIPTELSRLLNRDWECLLTI